MIPKIQPMCAPHIGLADGRIVYPAHEHAPDPVGGDVRFCAYNEDCGLFRRPASPAGGDAGPGFRKWRREAPARVIGPDRDGRGVFRMPMVTLGEVSCHLPRPPARMRLPARPRPLIGAGWSWSWSRSPS